MKLRSLLSALAVVLASVYADSARAQFVSVYGTVSGMRASGVQVSSSGQTATATSPAFGGGVTVNFLNLHIVKLGVDARGSAGTGTTKTNMGEISLRLGFAPPLINLKPFVQLGVGYAQPTVAISSGVGSTYTGKFLTYGGHAGLDHAIAPFLDLRLVDVGYAYGHDLHSGFASGKSNQGANFASIGAGLVARF